MALREWFVDRHKIKAALRKQRRGPKYLDLKSIREGREALYSQQRSGDPLMSMDATHSSSNHAARTKRGRSAAIAATASSTASTVATDSVGDDDGGAKGRRRTRRGDTAPAPVAVSVAPVSAKAYHHRDEAEDVTPMDSMVVLRRRRGAAAHEESAVPSQTHADSHGDSSAVEVGSSRRTVAARRDTSHSNSRGAKSMTKWVQCGKCDKWRVVVRLPKGQALDVWECCHRSELPTTCDDPDEADREAVMRKRLGIS